MGMSTRLILSRKVGERILIGNDIIIRVNSIRGEIVKLSIEAPQEIKILRWEIINEAPKSSSVDAQ